MFTFIFSISVAGLIWITLARWEEDRKVSRELKARHESDMKTNPRYAAYVAEGEKKMAAYHAKHPFAIAWGWRRH